MSEHEHEHEHEHNVIYDNLREKYNYPAPSVGIGIYKISEEFQKKIASADLTAKCYIEGELGTTGLEREPNPCCISVPGILLYSIDDIYFESDKNDE